jgi:hypothetical protein
MSQCSNHPAVFGTARCLDDRAVLHTACLPLAAYVCGTRDAAHSKPKNRHRNACDDMSARSQRHQRLKRSTIPPTIGHESFYRPWKVHSPTADCWCFVLQAAHASSRTAPIMYKADGHRLAIGSRSQSLVRQCIFGSLR